MNLIVGSTGVLGTEVCRRLRQLGQPVRALVRTTSDPAKVNALRAQGAEIVFGDLRDEASLRAACADVRCVISTASAMSSFSADNTFLLTDLGTKDLVDAARDAGVDQFVFVSFSDTLDPDADLKVAKRAVEEHIVNSGVSFTILRPTCFMESWLSPMLGFDFANGRAQIIGSGDAFISYISISDVAQFAIASIGNPEVRNATIDLGGPDVVSPLEVVRIAENFTGKTFAVTHIPVEALYAQHAASSNPLEKTFAALMIETTKGSTVPMHDVLRRFPGVTLKSVEEYVQQLVAPISAA
jgi:uncharacterized protein YbjT (DUF2867 family)